MLGMAQSFQVVPPYLRNAPAKLVIGVVDHCHGKDSVLTPAPAFIACVATDLCPVFTSTIVSGDLKLREARLERRELADEQYILLGLEDVAFLGPRLVHGRRHCEGDE